MQTAVTLVNTVPSVLAELLRGDYRLPASVVTVNLAGLPGLSIPCGFDSRGLPVGLQIIGNQGESNHLLATAMWCERQLPRMPIPG